MKRAPGTIYAVARTRQHVLHMAGAVRRLRARGYNVVFVSFQNNRGAAGALAQIQALRLPRIYFARFLSEVSAGDTVVFAVKAGFDTDDRFERLWARGVKFTQICEGGRFNRRAQYHPSLPIPFLAWGPSAHEIGLDDVRVVGAPAMEALQRSPDRPPRQALINYKFTYSERDLDPEGKWVRRAINAARTAGFDPVVSCHPATTRPDWLEASDRPVAELLAESEVLISRASTVIYDALMIGVQPVYFGCRGDSPREFGRPLGAYPICRGRRRLQEALIDWDSGAQAYDHAAFLDHHISRDPTRPATARMADEIEKIHVGPALTARAAAFVRKNRFRASRLLKRRLKGARVRA